MPMKVPFEQKPYKFYMCKTILWNKEQIFDIAICI